jgi:UDP-N-acetylmuramoylalanine--D-glutamate ligase
MKQLITYKNVLIVGMGVSGQAATSLLLKHAAKVTATDDNIEKINLAKELQELELQKVEDITTVKDFDLVVVSPGVPQNHPLYLMAKEASLEIIGEIELACRFAKQKVFGITGTNGKTTVTMMVAHVLNACGISAQVAGNIGEPLSRIITSHPHSIIVTELSSFQLDTLSTPSLDAAVLLNISPDHLDRYHSYDEYAQSKFHIQECLKQNAKFYINEKTAKEWKENLLGPFLAFNAEEKENIEYILPLRYRRDRGYEWENQLAAFALCHEVGISPKQFHKAIQSFEKAPHRVEFVRKIDDVAFVNDSKATNAEAVIRAVESMPGMVILIAGGQDKGLSYKGWVKAFKGKVRYVCAVGETAAQIKEVLNKVTEVKNFESLEKAVNFAHNISAAGETVLLSPGCSSFDMFKDYAQRGDKFKLAVRQL